MKWNFQRPIEKADIQSIVRVRRIAFHNKFWLIDTEKQVQSFQNRQQFLHIRAFHFHRLEKTFPLPVHNNLNSIAIVYIQILL